MTAALGIVFAVLVDIALPLTIGIVLIILDRRGSPRGRPDRTFWTFMAIYVGFVSVVSAWALVGVYSFNEMRVVIAVIASGPMSLIPTVINSTVLHYFFTSSTWTEDGQLVLTLFLVGLPVWASLLPLSIRRLVQPRARRRRRRTPAGAA